MVRAIISHENLKAGKELFLPTVLEEIIFRSPVHGAELTLAMFGGVSFCFCVLC